ncbi:MarR family winged helix-turn-helix transcriptional regulator [Pseudochelatococcus contaminans]|uniref:DNA-binding MarR family transcriptional regulator n=1 Tax=Pseudochelatococcus contaminans TaxID=1538103 RepID=A0A7W5Z290_9HYPH|nr:MarR family transcriptional regulator [Pseudochelatococcus contaminans]MBB3808502.1 DNA-binding MarR family transcriptional regulator [Pseudochelatococcus contaminans]
MTILPEDLARCLVLNTVAASRALLRVGDARLKPFGVTVQQLSLLAAIRFHPGQPVMSLAQLIALDRTSLTRNLDVLERNGLVRRVANAPKNARVCELTDIGNPLLDRLLLLWQESQAALMEGISPEDAETYLRISKRLAGG